MLRIKQSSRCKQHKKRGPHRAGTRAKMPTKSLRTIFTYKHPWKCNPSLGPRVSIGALTQAQHTHTVTAPPHAKGKSSHTTQINMSTARHCYPKVLSRFSRHNHHFTQIITQAG